MSKKSVLLPSEPTGKPIPGINPRGSAHTDKEVIPVAKNKRNRREQKTETAPRGAARDGSPGGAVPEELLRHKEVPGDRAVDVLDNHTPDIDL